MSRLPGRVLTVVIRDDAPLVLADSPPTRRSVRVILTDEQREALRLLHTGTSGGIEIRERIEACWIEPVLADGGDR